MAWIQLLPVEQAEGRLRTLFDRVKGPDGTVDEILRLHSLRPHTLEGHMALYKCVLHHNGNHLPKSLLEAIGVYVSMLNRCDYCVAHHESGLRRLLRDDPRADAIRDALASERPEDAFSPREAAALRYAEKLTRSPDLVNADDLESLRTAGLDDGEILEVNQVASYFAYANRVVLGLGASTKDDTLGLSPGNSDDPSDWRHG